MAKEKLVRKRTVKKPVVAKDVPAIEPAVVMAAEVIAAPNPVDAPVENAKPEKLMRVYKGDVKKTSDFTGKVELACEVIETEIPAIKGQWGKTGGKIPKLIVATEITPSGNGAGAKRLTYASYTGGFKGNAVNVPDDFQIKVLTGRQGQDMLKKYKEHKVSTLPNYLGYPHTIGADPEIFVEDKSGTVIPAFNFLGSKEKPNKTAEGMNAYWDGFQGEFTVKYNTCLAWVTDSVQHGLKTVYDLAKSKNKDAKLSIKTVMEIPYDMLQKSSEEHVALGCLPSLNVYGLEGKVVLPRELPFRSAGGHIHFGIGKKTEAQAAEIVKSLDAILGVACVSLFASFDNPIRREFYGLPGEYRLPEHGIEYRALSNAWMFHPTIMNMVFDLARKVAMFGANGFRDAWQGSEEETIDVVKHCDVARARQILDRNKPLVSKLMSAAYHGTAAKDIETLYGIFMNGMETAIKDPTDFVGNWRLGGGWQSHSDGPNCNVRRSLSDFNSGKKI